MNHATQWTYADWLGPPDDGYRYEVLAGELVQEPPPTPHHAAIISMLTHQLGQQLTLDEVRGLFGSTVGVRLAADCIVIPDLVYIRPGRRGMIGPRVIEGVPDLIGELLSPANRHHDLGRKRTLYARGGVPEYWLIDPADRSLTVLADPAGEAYLSQRRFAGDEPFRSPSLGWRLNLPELFAGY